MGGGLGGRGKRRRNITQKHGGAKHCGGVNQGVVTKCDFCQPEFGDPK